MTAASPPTQTQPASASATAAAPRRGRRRYLWLLVALLVLGVSAAVVVLAGARPSYDGFGFMVWGRQVLRWKLNTDGAPSWKPLPFLFTLPYALFGRAQMWLWMGTTVAGMVGGAVFGARVAWRLTGSAPGRRYAPYLAGAFAAAGVLGIATYSHLVLIANSDPLIVAACLAAIDGHLSGRPRLAFGMLVLASLGRPEAWPFALLYAIWAWRAIPAMRLVAVLGLVLIPAFWFAIPAVSSHSWFISGDLALNQATVIHGSKVLGVISRLRSLYELPMQIAFLCGVALAAIRRDRTTLTVAGCAVLWVAIEVGFAYHGWSAVARYMIEPAAVMVVIAASAVGRVLVLSPRPLPVRWVGFVPVGVLLVALAPAAQSRVTTTRDDLLKARKTALRINRLSAVIRQEGVHQIRSCGQPVSQIGHQSTLAWELDMNVGNVGYNPGKAIKRGHRIVVFRAHQLGWQVRPYDRGVANVTGACQSLRTDTPFGR